MSKQRIAPLSSLFPLLLPTLLWAAACGGGSSGSVSAAEGAGEAGSAGAGLGEGSAEAGSAEVGAEQPAEPPAVGGPAPDFRLPDLEGGEVRLADLRGRVVVLEWFNPDCPYVTHLHLKAPVASTAQKWTERGVAWLAVNSGAPGEQGTGLDHNRKKAARLRLRHPVLLDESGAVGRLYGAQRTPHVVVIDRAGSIVYAGAPDNAPRGMARGGTYENHVADALEALEAGEPVPLSGAPAYGCPVRYAD